jgi:hypothetical protein
MMLLFVLVDNINIAIQSDPLPVCISGHYKYI